MQNGIDDIASYLMTTIFKVHICDSRPHDEMKVIYRPLIEDWPWPLPTANEHYKCLAWRKMVSVGGAAFSSSR